MKRNLCFLAVLAIFALPDWASACWPLWGRPVGPAPAYYPSATYAPPAFASYPSAYAYAPVVGPIVAYPAMDSFPRSVPPVATPATAIVTPRQPENGSARSPSAVNPSALKGDIAFPQTAAPRSEAIQPAAGDSATAIPTPMPPQKAAAPDLSALPRPPAKNGAESLPPLVLPGDNELPGRKPPENAGSKKSNAAAAPSSAPANDWQPSLPAAPNKPSSPKPPAINPAIPTPAPASEPLIPSTSVPIIPGSQKSESLPSLSLPPAIPVNPHGDFEKTSRSSPLVESSVLAIKKFPVAASRVTDASRYRIVTFFNHAAQEVQLTIEGRTVRLPAKSYVEAKLGASFTWSYDDQPATREQIPDDAIGLDVLIQKSNVTLR